MKNRAAIRSIEKQLKLYRTYEASIANARRQLDYLIPAGVASYSAEPNAIGRISDPTGATVVLRQEGQQAEALRELIARNTLLYNSITDAVTALEMDERRVIEMRYFHPRPVTQIAKETGAGLRSVFAIKTRALEKLSISLQGLDKL